MTREAGIHKRIDLLLIYTRWSTKKQNKKKTLIHTYRYILYKIWSNILEAWYRIWANNVKSVSLVHIPV